MEDRKNDIGAEQIIRMDLINESAAYRLDERLEYLKGYDRNYIIMENALLNAEIMLKKAGGHNEKLLLLHDILTLYLEKWRNYNKFLVAIMNGRTAPGTREFAQFTFDALSYLAPTVEGKDRLPPFLEVENVMAHYISLTYGDPREPREIPCWAALWADIFVEEALSPIGEAGRKSKEARKRFHEGYSKKRMSWFNRKLSETWSGEERLKILEENRKEVEKEIGAILVNNDVYEFKNWYGEVNFADQTCDNLPFGAHQTIRLFYDPGNLSPRVLNRDERDALKKAYERHLTEKNPDIVNKIAAFVEFCVLLRQPENHIKVASGQYREKPLHMRPVHDMTDEMAQELASLPRSIAYAKVITENEGEQTIWKGKIKTLSLPSWHVQLFDGDSSITNRSHTFCKTRKQIEEEIRKRQERWRGSGSDEPPPTRD
jgi:hypothetical protein